ncbi:MAG: YHS domain-containing (seleno)protein [Cyanobacteria bacterium P01_G01_bin.54]
MQIHSFNKTAIATLLSLVVATGCTTTSSDNATSNTSTDSTETTTEATATEVRYFVDESGYAIRGTDPVAYFTEEAAVAGSDEFTHTWDDATWRFANAENRDRFAADPEKYAPQYGGFCAWAVSQGNTAPIDPEAWKIVEGKLYLNYDKRIQKRWEKDIPGNIEKANGNWPGVLG